MTDAPEPTPLEQSRRNLLQELSAEDWQRWRHHPVTAAYLQFLADQAQNFREAVTDMWELGALDTVSNHPDRNANVLRGRVLALRELIDLPIEAIQRFYADAGSVDGSEQA